MECKKWTSEEVELLKRLFAEGLTDDEIEMRMGGRTSGAVRKRRLEMGLRHNYKSNVVMTEKDLAKIKRMTLDCKSAEEIGREFGVSKHVVWRHIRNMGLSRFHKKNCQCNEKEEERTDTFDRRIFSSIRKAMEEYGGCIDAMVTYSTYAAGMLSNRDRGMVRCQYIVSTRKDADSIRRIDDVDYRGRVLAIRKAGVDVWRDETLLRKMMDCENMKGEVIVPQRALERRRDGED